MSRSKSTGALADTILGTTYLKLEPIKTEISFTTSYEFTDTDVSAVSGVSPSGLQLILTVGNTAFSGLTNGDWLQFCMYDPVTKIETELFKSKDTIFNSSSVAVFNFLGIAEEDAEGLQRTRRYARETLSRIANPHKFNSSPYLKIYTLPDNYVTKQINISSIQGYWQDPTFSNVMWIQHTACCSFTSGPFSPTVTSGESGPTAITQSALVSKAATGTEVFHNIIPYLDTIMTYAN